MQAVEFDALIDELRRAFDGDPWHGPSVMAALDGVDARAASVRAAPEVHTIHELVLHLAAWAGEVAQRQRGRQAREPEAGDWPVPAGEDERAWQAALTTLRSAHAEALAAVESLGADRLHEVVDDRRNAALGTGGSFAFTAHGLAQHYAYHGGQISLLKKLA
jgi:hypothetical protein